MKLVNGPKDVKIFINQTRTIDFDTAESSTSIQTLEYCDVLCIA